MSTWTDRNLGWLLWPLQGFDQQFLRSDVIGNYSRPYSWQANQLGHATIGLTTTLIFAWMTQHLLDSAALSARHYRTVLSKFELPLIGPFGDLGAYLFLALLILPVLAIASRQIGALLHERAVSRAERRDQKPPAAANPAFGAFSRLLWILTSILAGLLMGVLGWVEMKTRPPTELQSSVMNGLASIVIFLTAFIAVMVVISKMFRRIFDTDGLPSPDDVLIDGPRSRYGEIRVKAGYVAARIGLVSGLILGIFLVTYLFGHSFGLWDGDPPRVFAQMSNRLQTAVVAMVAVTFAALAALESRTPYYTILSWLTIAAAALMFDDTALLALAKFSPFGVVQSPIEFGKLVHAEAPVLFASCAAVDGRAATLVCGEGVVFSTIAVLAFLTIIALMIGKARTNSARFALLAGFVFFVFFIFVASRSGADEPAWRQAIAAGLTALAIWWVKEFGNDIVRVDRGIREAMIQRKKNGYPAVWRNVTAEEDVGPAVREYRRDALADALTDSVFYLTGAVIGAGILYAQYGANGASTIWQNLPATLGFAFFMLVYILVGHSWTRRSGALDEIQVFKAFRFGMIPSALAVRVYRPAADSGQHMEIEGLRENGAAPRPDRQAKSLGSMQTLLAFSRGSLCVEAGGEPVKHLLIVGRFGSGRTDLGNAVASEAALCNIPPIGARKRDQDQDKREVRYFTLNNVLELPEDDGHRAAAQGQGGDTVAERVTIDLRMRVDKPDMFVLNEANPFATDVLDTFRAAEDTDATTTPEERRQVEAVAEQFGEPTDPHERRKRSAVRRQVLERALDRLKVDSRDQTVWIFGAEVERPDPNSSEIWNPTPPESVSDYLEDLATALAGRLGVSPSDIPIAVALIARRKTAPAAERM